MDDFAQELRQLHSKAYSTTTSANPEAEQVGQIVLVNQFVSGLRAALQAKVVEVEGSMDEMIAKARFEETKRKELADKNPTIVLKKGFPSRTQSGGNAHRPPPRGQTPTSTSTTRPVTTRPSNSGSPGSKTTRPGPIKCFSCGLEGHISRNCPYRRPKSDEQESAGARRVGTMTSEAPQEGMSTASEREIEELMQQAELTAAIQAAGGAGMLNVVQSVKEGKEHRLGPTIITPVQVNGVTTNALVETGSPATIVSLKFVLDVLRKNRIKDQTDQEWQEATRKWFTDPDVTLRSYGGVQLHFLAEIELSISQGDQQVEVVALVWKDAPIDLLIGTDAQPRLGFSLYVRGTDGRATNLFSGRLVFPDDMLQEPPETPIGAAASDPPTERSLSSCDNQLVMDPSHQYSPQRGFPHSDSCRYSSGH